MASLIDLVKNECILLPFNIDNLRNDPTFGIDKKTYQDCIAYCAPYHHLPKWGFSYWFSPKEVKEIIDGKNSGYESLQIFHYKINIRKLKNDFYKSTEVHRGFFKWYFDKFEEGSVIHLNIFSDSILVGGKRIMQDVVDLFKEKPLNSIDFLHNLTGQKFAFMFLHRKSVHIYDSLKKPKETYYKL